MGTAERSPGGGSAEAEGGNRTDLSGLSDQRSLTPDSGAVTREPSTSIRLVGQLANSVAHEMNNVLATVMGLASVIQQETDPGSTVHQDIQTILEASRRGMDLTRNLLLFSPHRQAPKRAVSLNDLVGTVHSLLLRTTAEHTGEKQPKVELALDPRLPDILGDENQLRQMLINLANNALEAMPAGGTLTVATQVVDLGPSDVASTPSMTPGRHVRLQVSDTGVGMDDQTLGKAFDPFFTTRQTRKAPGLGLSLVYDGVTRHGGKVDIFSRKGLGTTVTLHFASLELADEPGSGRRHRKTAPEKKSGTVLLVDDDALVRKSTGRMLKKLGYEVIPVSGGAEALSAYRTSAKDITLVMVDLIMPDMDGTEVLQRLKRIDPSVCVVVCSGYPGGEATTRQLGCSGYASKPFTLESLSDALEEALEETS